MPDIQIIEVQVPGIQGPVGPTGSLQNTYPVVTTVAGTTYTLASGDLHKLVVFTSASPVTVTLPNGLIAGFTCTLCQMAGGSVRLVAASGASVFQPDGHNGLDLQYSTAALAVVSNVGGASAVYVLGGRTALIA